MWLYQWVILTWFYCHWLLVQILDHQLSFLAQIVYFERACHSSLCAFY